MKKTVRTIVYSVLCSLCIFVSVDGYSQEQQTSTESTLTPKMGIKGGVNFTNLYINDVENESMKVGGQVGIFAKIPLSEGVSFMPELLYSNKGTKATYDNAFQGSGEYRFNLNYIEAPVTFAFNIVENFSLHAGGYAAFLASANVKNLQDGTIQDAEQLDSDDFNRWDYGLVGGAAFDIDHFTIGARYNYGLSEVGKSGSLAGNLTNDAKNSAFTLFLGFAF